MADEQYTSNERVYVDKDGRVVRQGDKSAAKLLVAAGASIPMERARAAGLVVEGQSGEASASALPAASSSEPAESGRGLIDPKEESARVQGKSPAKRGSKKAGAEKSGAKKR